MKRVKGKSRQPGPDTGVRSDSIFGVADQRPGFVDFFGYLPSAGWIFSGWIRKLPTTVVQDVRNLAAQFHGSIIQGHGLVSFFHRSDLGPQGTGFVILLRASRGRHFELSEVSLQLDGATYRASGGPSTLQLRDADLRSRLQPILSQGAYADEVRAKLLRIVSRPAFSGEDTIAALPETMLIEVDEAIVCPPDGLLLMGWQIGSKVDCTFCLRSGHQSTELSFEDGIRLPRPDVIEAVREQADASDVMCGFLLFVPKAYAPGEDCYLEVETKSGHVGFKRLHISKRYGMSAIRRMLEDVNVRYGALDHAFDTVLGPAITALNASRLERTEEAVEIDFGPQPKQPRASLVIPLYGRIDFLEYQLAFFSGHPSYDSIEIIYVLDDPPKRRQLEDLCQSAYARFKLPFRLLVNPRNLGFAPANNAGLRVARGKYICFLNSDVFPGSDDWLDRCIAALEADRTLGVISPRLLYEDGSIQHQGCSHRPLAEFGGWLFPGHENKGLRPNGESGIRRCELTTGACMVMSHELIKECGGFDEGFVTGDFEDADLCMKIRSRGLDCAVDLDRHLYHLERKSQLGPAQLWRMNLTLFNAWVYQRRWHSRSEAMTTKVVALPQRARPRG